MWLKPHTPHLPDAAGEFLVYAEQRVEKVCLVTIILTGEN